MSAMVRYCEIAKDVAEGEILPNIDIELLSNDGSSEDNDEETERAGSPETASAVSTATELFESDFDVPSPLHIHVVRRLIAYSSIRSYQGRSCSTSTDAHTTPCGSPTLVSPTTSSRTLTQSGPLGSTCRISSVSGLWPVATCSVLRSSTWPDSPSGNMLRYDVPLPYDCSYNFS